MHMEGVLLVSFGKKIHKDSIWNIHRAVILYILHKLIFLNFVHNGARFYEKYISSKNKKNILMMTKVEFYPIKRLERSTIQNINLLIQIDNRL